MSTPTLHDLTDVMPVNKVNKVVRIYAITPKDLTVNGHRLPTPEPMTVGLRYSETEAETLHRDAADAAAEALRMARKRGLPRDCEVDIVCVRETLKPDDRFPQGPDTCAGEGCWCKGGDAA